jgi:heme oxygenase
MTLIDDTGLDTELFPPLSVAMREGSQTQHTAAEGATFTSELLAGRINEQGYADYLRCLRQVYAALEEVGRSLRHHPVGVLYDPDLERLQAIDADLDHWLSPGQPREIDSPAAAAYAQRIRDTQTSPVLFAAHHYTRYLGDLSGGQAIGRVLDRSFGLEGKGLSFYAFAAIPKPKPYKDTYRARLDALELTRDERQQVVTEVQLAFGHNQALFEELGTKMQDYRR